MWFLHLLSPSYWLISRLKKGLSETQKTTRLRRWSRGALILTVAAVAATLIAEQFVSVDSRIIVGLGYLAFVRLNEIVFAFFKDAHDRLSDEPQTTTFTPPQRLKFVATSYLEMIVCFGFAYLGLQSALASLASPVQAFKAPLPGLAEAIYFSSTVITTLGYGENDPAAWLAKILTIWEVFSGFILFAVALAVYLGSEKTAPGAVSTAQQQLGNPAHPQQGAAKP